MVVVECFAEQYGGGSIVFCGAIWWWQYSVLYSGTIAVFYIY